MKNVILYSSNCPRCVILEKKLQIANVEYSVESSEESQKQLFNEGFREMPVLEVDGKKYTFGEAIQLVNTL